MKNYTKLNVFWREDSSDLINFHNLLKDSGAFSAKLVIHDSLDSHGTGYFVRKDYIKEFKELLEECNLIID